MSLNPAYGKGTGGDGGSGGPLTPQTEKITADYQVKITDDHIISNGDNTITFPLFASATKPFFITNEGALDDTLDGNGSTIPNGTQLTSTEVRGFAPGITGWVEQ